VNGPLLASIVFASHATRAFVEHVSARPGEGAVGAFAFGRSRVGVIEGVLAAAGVRCQFLTPACWKRTVGLPPGRILLLLVRAVKFAEGLQPSESFGRLCVSLRVSPEFQ
jgi:hypothetical protein